MKIIDKDAWNEKKVKLKEELKMIGWCGVLLYLIMSIHFIIEVKPNDQVATFASIFYVVVLVIMYLIGKANLIMHHIRDIALIIVYSVVTAFSLFMAQYLLARGEYQWYFMWPFALLQGLAIIGYTLDYKRWSRMQQPIRELKAKTAAQKEKNKIKK